MSPVPDRRRLTEYGVKAAHLALRQVARAPEQDVGRRLAAAAGSGPPHAHGRRVAILTPRSWAVHVQWETTIAQALRLRGADVRFITCGGELEICDRVNTHEGPPVPCRSCRKYVHDTVDAHGFPRRTILEGWQGTGAEHDDWPELNELSLQQLLAVEDAESGLPLGELARIPVSWFLMGAELETDPLAALTYRRFLRSGRRIARGLVHALDAIRPDVVLLCNGLFFFEAIAWALCRERGIDVVTYERGFIKETLLFRRDEPACLGDVSHLWAQWRDISLRDDEERRLDEYLDDRRQGRRTIDRYWINPTFAGAERRRSGRLVTLFTNLTWDSAVIGQGLAYDSIQDWLAACIELFAERPEDELVVRVHPAEVKLPGKQTREPLGEFLEHRFPTLPPNVRIIGPEDPQSSYPLMEGCDLGLVFTSTTGLELALHGKPVVVAGNTHYRGKGFTVEVSSPEELRAAIDRLLADPASGAPDADLARRYSYLFFFRAPIEFSIVEEHVPGLARILVSDPDQLRPGHDPAVDRIVSGILDGGDFAPPSDQAFSSTQ
jgi:hypothetical protein